MFRRGDKRPRIFKGMRVGLSIASLSQSPKSHQVFDKKQVETKHWRKGRGRRMPSVGWEERPRFKQCFSPLASFENGLAHHRSASYFKLPEQLLKLSVLKLDGSSFGERLGFLLLSLFLFWFCVHLSLSLACSFPIFFFFSDVHISRWATIAELKLVVEELFSRSPDVEEEGEISWYVRLLHSCGFVVER